MHYKAAPSSCKAEEKMQKEGEIMESHFKNALLRAPRQAGAITLEQYGELR